MVTIYHNGECSKSKGALEILQEQGVAHEIRYYLIEPPTIEELRTLVQKLHLQTKDVIRKNEPLYLEKFDGQDLTNEQWLQVLVDNPELLERPIVVNGDKAVIARPPETVHEIL